MEIRWYKNGKFSQPFNDQNTTEIGIDSIVKSISRPYYFNQQGFPNFNENRWELGPTVTHSKVIDKMHIESDYYTGDLIKIGDYWPWFQITSFELY